MSAIIRQQLKSLLPAISADIAKGTDLETLPNDPSSLDSISVGAENLSRKVSRAQIQLETWTSILTSPDKDIRDEENALFAGFLVEGKLPSDVISEGWDTVTKLEIKIDRIRNSAPQTPPNLVQPSAPAIRPMINLPALQLPDFDGHEGNWPSFWAAFGHTIHDNPSLPGAQKLTYLVGRLRGNARTLVDGFALTDHNYPIVVDLLKGRYGDDNKRADRLRSELFHLARPSGHSNSLRAFSESVDRICRQLESLGSNLDDNPFLTVAIKEKLPTEIKAQLYDKEMEEGTPWSSKQWRERLARVVRLKEAVHAPWETLPGPVQSRHKSPPRPAEPIRRAFPVVNEVRKPNFNKNCCSLCLRDGHKPSNCLVYRSAAQRMARLAEQGRCSLCAREGHHQDICSSTALCFRCKGRHHVVVCPGPGKPPTQGSNSVPLGPRNTVGGTRPEGSTQQVSTTIVLPSGGDGTAQISSPISENEFTLGFTEFNPRGQTRPTAYLMIKEIPVFNNNGPSPISAPVFFDPGSQPGFIGSNLVSEIKPDLIQNEKMAVTGFSGNNPPLVTQFFSPRFSVRLKRSDGGWETVELNQTPQIVPPVEFVKEIHWASPGMAQLGITAKEPQILLGVREFWRFFLGKREILPGLYRIETVFGPVFGGAPSFPVNLAPATAINPSFVCPVISRKPEELVKQLWSLESIGIRDPLDPNDESLALALFSDSVKFKDGRYEVGWPWRPGGKDRLSTNFSLAYSRLSALSHKLRDNSEFREKYQATITEQIERGIIEPAVRKGAQEHFIPHHAVVSPKKLRVVYDASAREKGKASLNDLLLPGPNLVPELAGILLRFRASTCPVLGDIEKAFLAVGLREEDREVAKFLWFRDPSQPLSPQNFVVYRFKRIAFGVNASPFLLASVLRHHLSTRGDPLEMAKNFYVDNLLICSESPDEAAAAVRVARQTISDAGMHLREFVAADPNILSELPPGDVMVGDVQKVLGLSWNLSKDKLLFELPNPSNFLPTRRGILSAIASLFDPLGLCSPCLVKSKVFFQSLWDSGTGWDGPIGKENEQKWTEISSEWSDPSLTFSRLTPGSQGKLQLHIFSDAGPNSYAAAVYLRAERNGTPSQHKLARHVQCFGPPPFLHLLHFALLRLAALPTTVPSPRCARPTLATRPDVPAQLSPLLKNERTMQNSLLFCLLTFC